MKNFLISDTILQSTLNFIGECTTQQPLKGGYQIIQGLLSLREVAEDIAPEPAPLPEHEAFEEGVASS